MSVCSLAMLSTDGSPYLNNSKAITMELPLNRDELRQRWEAGERFDFYFFYGHKPPATGVNASCLSQWFEAGFTINDIYYQRLNIG